MIVAKGDAIGKGNTGPIIPAYPETGCVLLGLHELINNFQMTKLILRDRSRPELKSNDLGFRGIGFQEDLSATLVDLGDNFFVR